MHSSLQIPFYLLLLLLQNGLYQCLDFLDHDGVQALWFLQLTHSKGEFLYGVKIDNLDQAIHYKMDDVGHGTEFGVLHQLFNLLVVNHFMAIRQGNQQQNHITASRSLNIQVCLNYNQQIFRNSPLIMATPQNHFTFQIKNPTSTKNKTNNNMVAMKRIDNYSYAMSDEIGLGFTSHVYRGRCEQTNKEVAVKVIELKNNEDELHANFLKEEVTVLETIKGADPKNLLKLQKVIKSKNNLYIITEFCQGNDLAKILRKKKLFSQVQGQSIMKQTLNGYKELYRLKIVHRDLKLANLFITKGNVKIADFGFAIGQQQCRIKMDYNVGSPYYMPPESLRNNQYSYLSDVWALGVIAYQLVYGRVPWKDKDDEVLYEMIMNCPVDRLFDSDKEVGEHYKKFIRACLTIDKRHRATPQFIINYPWPLAQEHVEGLEQPNQFRQSMGGRLSLPRMSVERPQLKKVVSDNHSQQELMRKRTPSVDNLRNLVKYEDKPPTVSYGNIPPRSQNVISKSFIQQPKVLYNDGSRERGSVVRHSQTKLPQPSIQLQPQTQPQMQPQIQPQLQPQIQPQGTNGPEAAIIGQIHYCRFMMQLLRILYKSYTKNDYILRISSDLSTKITQKMRLLVKLAQSQQNVFKCSNFASYIRSPRWQSLRQVIYKYDMKFRQDINSCSTPIFANVSVDASLTQALKQMKNNLTPANLKIAELLTYYYQLKEEEGKIAPEDLEERIKISYIVDQCKNYSADVATYDRNNGQMPERKERFLKKLLLLGL